MFWTRKVRFYLLNCLRKMAMFIPRLGSRMETWERGRRCELETHTHTPTFSKQQRHAITHTSALASLNEPLIVPPLVGLAFD